MDRVIGGVLGLAAGIAVVSIGLLKGLSLEGVTWRALLAAIVGYLIGRLVFGKAGVSVMKEAAAPEPSPSEEEPGAPPTEKPKSERTEP